MSALGRKQTFCSYRNWGAQFIPQSSARSRAIVRYRPKADIAQSLAVATYRTFVAVICLSICGHAVAQGRPVSGACVQRPGAEGKLLEQVCEYIIRKQIPVTSHPNSWSVRRTEEVMIDGKPAVMAYLSCCYLGDIVTFDKATGEIVRYQLGDK